MAANRHKNPEQFKKMRNHVNNIINKSKNSYFKKYFSEHSKNAKKVWEGIRCAIEWKRSNSNSIASITDNYGQTVTEDASIAQSFANHFKEIPQNSVSKIRKGSTKTDYTRKAVKTIILTLRLASSNHYQLGCDDQLIILII